MESIPNILENISLANRTTLRIGGNAKFFAEAKTEVDVANLFAYAEEKSLEVFILGGGSNVLIADEGFSGLVLKVGLKGISEQKNDSSEVLVTAGAGEDWDAFVDYCVRKKLSGLECLSGIPGLVGGTPIQNVGAYGQEVSETIVNVRVYDRKNKEIFDLTNEDCRFRYRESIFNTTENGRYFVLSVTYKLIENGLPKLAYRELAQYFKGKDLNLKEVRNFVCELRENKGMLVRQGGLDSQSAGSFFKNPVVSLESLTKIEKIASKICSEKVPRYSVGKECYKVPAAWLIEKTGFGKGFTKGNAGLSTKHTLAITNRGNCSAREILELKKEIQDRVRITFGVSLLAEPNFVGFAKGTNDR